MINLIDELQKHLYSEFYIDSDKTGNKRLNWSDLNNYEHEGYHLVLTLEICCFGDYDNSCHVERANFDYLLEKLTELKLLDGIHAWEISGGFGSKGIALSPIFPDCASELVEEITALADYPCFDDELVSFKAEEMFQAWLKDNASYWFADILDGENDAQLLTELENLICNNDNGDSFIIEAGGNVYVENIDSFVAQLKENYANK